MAETQLRLGGGRVSQAVLGIPTGHSPQLAAPVAFLFLLSRSHIKLDGTLRITEPQSLPFERGRGKRFATPGVGKNGLLGFGLFAQRPFPNDGCPNLILVRLGSRLFEPEIQDSGEAITRAPCLLTGQAPLRP